MKITCTIPNIFTKYKPRSSLFFCLKILHNTQTQGFRVLFGKPVNGQRTICNGKTAKKQQSPLYSFKYKHLNSLVSGKLTKPMFVAEYVNLYWQQQYTFEWVSSYKTISTLPIYLKKTNFIDVANLNNFYIYSSYNNPFKKNNKNKHKRKKTTPRNKFTTGLPFGFSLIYKKQLNSIR
jgi:hypothetical protein